jgi:hypothetical protein
VLCIAALVLGKAPLAATAPPPTPVGGSFFDQFDDPKLFNDPVKSRWKTSGTVTVANGTVTIGNPANNMENVWIISAAEYKGSFTMEVRARLLSQPRMWGGYGLWFRMPSITGIYRDGGSGYTFDYVYGYRGATLLRWPNSYPIGPKAPIAIDGRWHVLKVVARGSQFQCFVDGQLVTQGTDSQYPSGHLGIGTCYRGCVQVDWVRVTVP